MKVNLDRDDYLYLGGLSLVVIVSSVFLGKDLALATVACLGLNLLLICGMSALDV